MKSESGNTPKTGLENFRSGIKDGMPIALGYLAVSFSLGIQAKSAGITAFWAALMSLLNVTSAGQFAGISIIAALGGYLEIALSQLIINMRYLLMSCALSQKISPDTPYYHRFLMPFGVTDEIFGISVNQKKFVPAYMYGAMSVAIPGWVLGTFLGVILGNILPAVVVSALSVALYGMFIAIVVPPSKENKTMALAVIISMLASFICHFLPVIREISSGTKIIVLTVVISLLFAIVAPVKDDESSDKEVEPHA